MYKNTVYIIIAAAIGLFIGWIVFSSNTTPQVASDHNHEQSQQWTCSMHPQIMKSEPGDCPICGMDLIPAAASNDGLTANAIKMTANAMALANIQTTVVGNGTATTGGSNQISLSGKILPNEENSTVQASYFSGRIEKLNINYTGQQVSKGQLLATIYAPDLLTAQQELITTAAIKNSQPGLYEAVRNKLKLWKLSDSQINAIEKSGKVKESFPVYATVSGTVSQVMAATGDYINQGQPIVKLTNFNSVWASFDIYENQLALIKTGQAVTVTTNAYPNKTFNATLSFIDPILNTSTRIVAARATLSNSGNLLKPGMFVTGKIASSNNTAGISNTGILVPASAVLWTGKRSVVYIKTSPDAPVFEMREVSLGAKTDSFYNVVSGLSTGDVLVTNGTFTVDAAAQLQGKKSMMNQQNDISQSENTQKTETTSFPAAYVQSFNDALPSYYKLKDAFITSDKYQVEKATTAAITAFKAIKTNQTAASTQASITNSIQLLNRIKDGSSIENQRKDFVTLNKEMVFLAGAVSHKESPVYVLECPMAKDNKAAQWLSNSKEVRNPYFGDAMLTCGGVIKELR